MTFEVRVSGLRELRVALIEAEGSTDLELGKALGKAAIPVRDDARARAAGYSPKTVAGVRIRRRGTNVRVEQGQRKTTGFHPSYGAFQQKHFFDPALVDHQAEAIRLATDAIGALADAVNRAR